MVGFSNYGVVFYRVDFTINYFRISILQEYPV
jgi:hypothetical protein